ncbi:MAG: response regulator [Anaerolineae bacterium]|jgi:signal transduction histidine kinase|nr:response regulator [Anaerolineae bacterium]
MYKGYILVVEDHQLLLEAIQDLLQVAGYEVATGSNGFAALESIKKRAPDLILSDITMPQMDGYDLYQKVRENPSWVRIPFIFLTARGERTDVLRGKALGVEDYIVKPFDTEDLLIAIESRLGRAQAIQQAANTEFEQLKQQILNVLSHELRTPLTYISGYTDLALEDAGSLSPEELQEFLLGIKRGSDRLTKLVKDMLLVVQIDTGRSAEEFRSFADVSPHLEIYLRHIVESFRPTAQSAGVTLEYVCPEPLPATRIHEEFLGNALGRIIENAIKFSHGPNKPVTVEARAVSNWIEVSVTDQGVGLSPEATKNIFKRFQQFDRDVMEQQGAGLGMFIAYSLIQLHSGDITVTSQIGQGSTFTLKIPVIGK